MNEKACARKLPAWMKQQQVHGEFSANTSPPLAFEGTVKYCATVDDLGLACEELISLAERKGELVVGLDAEWPVYSKGGSGKIALIQVCPNETICYLFHVCCMRSIPKIFQCFIQHPNIRIVGSCVQNDIWKLGRDFNIPVAKLVGSGRVINLGDFANQVLKCAETWSLDRLALHLMSTKIDKSDSIRKSRWDLELSPAQQLYAATDAFASLIIYKKLKEKEQLAQ